MGSRRHVQPSTVNLLFTTVARQRAALWWQSCRMTIYPGTACSWSQPWFLTWDHFRANMWGNYHKPLPSTLIEDILRGKGSGNGNISSVGMWVGGVLLVGLAVSFDWKEPEVGWVHFGKRRVRTQRSSPSMLDDILALPLDRILFSPFSSLLRMLGKSLIWSFWWFPGMEIVMILPQ